MASLVSMVVTGLTMDAPLAGQTLAWFVSISMVLLGLQKLKVIEQFATMFMNYDLLAQRWVLYGYVYPFIESGTGLPMMADVFTLVAAPLAIVAVGIGAISIDKAVYMDRPDIKCACVGVD